MLKSLKAQNNWKIWLVSAFNIVFFVGLIEVQEITLTLASNSISQVERLLPIGLAGLAATILNAIFSANFKASLTHWRLRHALPGHRSFSVYAKRDSRIDVSKIKTIINAEFPSDPSSEPARGI
jgi:hypothetical protein